MNRYAIINADQAVLNVIVADEATLIQISALGSTTPLSEGELCEPGMLYRPDESPRFVVNPEPDAG